MHGAKIRIIIETTKEKHKIHNKNRPFYVQKVEVTGG